MKKLVLLDADVIIDLHSLRLFDALTKGYEVYVARTVLREARYYPYKNQVYPIDIKGKVTVVDVLDEQSLLKVKLEAGTLPVRFPKRCPGGDHYPRGLGGACGQGTGAPA